MKRALVLLLAITFALPACDVRKTGEDTYEVGVPVDRVTGGAAQETATASQEAIRATSTATQELKQETNEAVQAAERAARKAAQATGTALEQAGKEIQEHAEPGDQR